MKYLVRGCEAVEGVANYKNHVENCFYIFLDVFQSRKQVSSIQNVSRNFFLRTAKHRLTEKVKRFVYTFFPCTCTNFFDIIRRRAKCNCYRAKSIPILDKTQVDTRCYINVVARTKHRIKRVSASAAERTRYEEAIY